MPVMTNLTKCWSHLGNSNSPIGPMTYSYGPILGTVKVLGVLNVPPGASVKILVLDPKLKRLWTQTTQYLRCFDGYPLLNIGHCDFLQSIVYSLGQAIFLELSDVSWLAWLADSIFLHSLICPTKRSLWVSGIGTVSNTQVNHPSTWFFSQNVEHFPGLTRYYSIHHGIWEEWEAAKIKYTMRKWKWK